MFVKEPLGKFGIGSQHHPQTMGMLFIIYGADTEKFIYFKEFDHE